MSIRTKILDKGRINQEQLIRFLIKVEEKLENASGSSYDDTKVKSDISSLEARVKALEDAQGTPTEP